MPRILRCGSQRKCLQGRWVSAKTTEECVASARVACRVGPTLRYYGTAYYLAFGSAIGKEERSWDSMNMARRAESGINNAAAGPRRHGWPPGPAAGCWGVL